MKSSDPDPCFLYVKPGDFVVVEEESGWDASKENNWWIGQVISTIGGARDPSENTLIQLVNIDTGIVKLVNADLITKTLSK